MTLKVHIIQDHYEDYFKKSGLTFKDTNGEYLESILKKSEETLGFRVVKQLGTPIHKVKSLASITLFNSKKSGESPPVILRKKSSTHIQ